MNAKDIVTIAGTALVTAGVALIFMAPAFVDAGSDGLTAKIESPKLSESGVEFTVTAPRAYTEGEQPEVELTGVNTTDEVVTLTVETAMSALPGPFFAARDGSLRSMSRMPARTKELFREQYSLKLGPHQVKTLTVATKAALPANSMVNVSLQRISENPDSRPVVMLSFATAKPVTN